MTPNHLIGKFRKISSSAICTWYRQYLAVHSTNGRSLRGWPSASNFLSAAEA